MKKLSKLKLRESDILKDSQMKAVTGGYNYGSSDCSKPWHEACKEKSVGDRCTFSDGGVTKSGYCSQNAFNPCKYCFQGTPHY